MDRQRRVRALIGLAIALAGGAALFAWRRRADALHAADDAVAASATAPPRLQRTPVFVANHGKLVGAFNGFAWVVASEGVRIDTPDPCDERSCFRGTDGMLCARGSMRAPSSAAAGSRPTDPWALKIGWDVRREGGPWGAAAKPYVSLDYRGADHARLAAHRSADPAAMEYCIDDYLPGELVGSGRFRAECWKGQGEPLASFDGVDKFVLELPTPRETAPFAVCITAIAVGEPVDAAAEPREARP